MVKPIRKSINKEAAKKHKNFIDPPPRPKYLVFTYKLNEVENKVRDKLIAMFPSVFDENNIRPLGSGMRPAILAKFKEIGFECDKKMLNDVIMLWTRSLAYKKSLIQNKYRYDLDGNIAGEVMLDMKKDALVAMEYYLFHYKRQKEKEERQKKKALKKDKERR